MQSRCLRTDVPGRRLSVRRLWTPICAVCVFLATPAGAGNIASFELERQGDGYRLQAQGLIEGIERVSRIKGDASRGD